MREQFAAGSGSAGCLNITTAKLRDTSDETTEPGVGNHRIMLDGLQLLGLAFGFRMGQVGADRPQALVYCSVLHKLPEGTTSWPTSVLGPRQALLNPQTSGLSATNIVRLKACWQAAVLEGFQKSF